MAVFENAENVRRGLGVKLGDALAGAEATVEFVRDVHRTNLRAFGFARMCAHATAGPRADCAGG